jgi:hypothetical protein
MTKPHDETLDELPPAQVEDETGTDPAELIGEPVDDDLDEQ